MQSGAENYTVKSFMRKKLGLSGAELQVYAVIYSFSRDGIGEFTGSRGYIAETIGFSQRTVVRALAELTKRGYINRRRSPVSNAYIYTASLKLAEDGQGSVCQKGNEQGEECQKGKCRKGNDTVPVWQEESAVLSPNNKEDNKEIINASSSTSPKRAAGAHEEEKNRRKDGLKRKCDEELCIHTVEGASFDFRFSEEQYIHLIKLVGGEVLNEYISRLDTFMYTHRNKRPHSPYRTILKWIREDLSAEADAAEP